VPSGTYIDMAVNLPLVDPAKVLAPVLMTRGEWDGNSTDDDLLEFFRKLPNGDRQYVILPNTAHSQGFGKNRQLLWYAVNFSRHRRRWRVEPFAFPGRGAARSGPPQIRDIPYSASAKVPVLGNVVLL